MAIYQFTIELKAYKPRMWRRVLVNDDITVAQLGYIVLCLFRAECSHLMAIEKPAVKDGAAAISYEIPNPYEDDDLDDDFYDMPALAELRKEIFGSDYTMPQMPKRLNATTELMKDAVSLDKNDNILIVNYDFGDDWNFKLTLEKILDKSEVKQKDIPCVIAGKGFGIIDDCGGVFGLMRIAEAAELKSGDAYEEYCDWIDLDALDLSYFDKNELNELLEDELESIQEAYECPQDDDYE